MARQVTGTTNQFLNVVTGGALPYPLTISFRVKLTAATSSGPIPVAYGEAYPDWDAEYTGASTGGLSAISGKGATFSGTVATGGPIAVGGWHLYVGVWASATNRRVYVDGSAITAVDPGSVPAGTHANKNFTIGGVLVSAGGIHTPAGYDGEIADVAIWNTDLVAGDVDALAAGLRPGDVKPGNLQGWWKLGADGSLANSAGPLGAMTVSGTCPVTPDPTYAEGPFYKPKLIHAPDRFTGIAATDPHAPSRDYLGFWFAGVPPYTDERAVWNARTGYAPLVPAVGPLLEGEDRSVRVPGTGAYVQTDFSSPPWGGFAWACWIKIYSFPSNGNLLAPNMIVYAYPEGGGYWQSWGFFNDGGVPYGLQYRLSYSRLNAYAWHGGIECAAQLPRDEWIHVAISLPQTGTETVRYFYNGKFISQGVGTTRSDIPVGSTMAYVGASGILGDAPGDYAMKDLRYYGRYLTDEEIYQVYLHSRDFHIATSGLVDTAIRSVPVEYVPDPSHVPDLYRPNIDLTWVQRATHIWALHPSHPLKADKGGLTLTEVAGTVAPPVALASPENTMEFHGGTTGTAWAYRTIGSFIFGDNPAVAGNQTPPVIGALSFWYRPYTGAAGAVRIIGMPDNITRGVSVSYNTGNTFTTIQNSSLGPLQSLNAWHHIAVTNDGSFRRIWLDGVKVTENTNVATAVFEDLALQIGFYFSAGPFPQGLDGRIRLVSVINGALWTDAEILEQFQRPFAYYGPAPPPVTGALSATGLSGVALRARGLKHGDVDIAGASEIYGRGSRGVSGQVVWIGDSEFISAGYKAARAILALTGDSELAAAVRKVSIAQLAITGADELVIGPTILVPSTGVGRVYCIPATNRDVIVGADGSIFCMSTICLGGTDVSFFTKDPVAKLDYTWNWAAWLGDDTIAVAEFTADPGITITASEYDATTARVGIAGGAVFHTYQVHCTITTSGGRTDKRTALFLIQNQ